jgi:hypothetical protein
MTARDARSMTAIEFQVGGVFATATEEGKSQWEPVRDIGWPDAQFMDPRSMGGDAGSQYTIPGTVMFFRPVGHVSVQ